MGKIYSKNNSIDINEWLIARNKFENIIEGVNGVCFKSLHNHYWSHLQLGSYKKETISLQLR